MKCFKCDRCGAVIINNNSPAGHIAHRDLDAKKYFFLMTYVLNVISC